MGPSWRLEEGVWGFEMQSKRLGSSERTREQARKTGKEKPTAMQWAGVSSELLDRDEVRLNQSVLIELPDLGRSLHSIELSYFIKG